MPVPDYQTMMRPVLQAFADGATNVSDILPKLQREFAITADEAEARLPSGAETYLSNRAHWARSYLSKAGCLTSPKRNVHIITEQGRKLLRDHPERIDNKVLKTLEPYRAWIDDMRSKRPIDDKPDDDVESTPLELAEKAFRQIRQELEGEILQAIRNTTWSHFERVIVDVLIAMGFGGGDPTAGQAIGKSGDGGIDGIINEDALGLDAVYLQAKKYKDGNNIGRPAIQQFVGSLTVEGATKGVFVTTSDFSREARDYADRVQHRIILINGPQLARLMVQYGVGVRQGRSFTLQHFDEAYFPEIAKEDGEDLDDQS